MGVFSRFKCLLGHGVNNTIRTTHHEWYQCRTSRGEIVLRYRVVKITDAQQCSRCGAIYNEHIDLASLPPDPLERPQ